MAKSLKQEISEAYQQVLNECNSLSDTEDIIQAFESFVSLQEKEQRKKEEQLEGAKRMELFWKNRSYL
mgnify:FL=1